MLGTKYMYCDLNVFIYIFILYVICCMYNLLVLYQKIVLFFYNDILVRNKCKYFVHATTHLKQAAQIGVKHQSINQSINQSIKNVIQGRIQGGAHPARAPPKIGKNLIFWRKIVIFHTKYPQKFRASLRSAQFF